MNTKQLRALLDELEEKERQRSAAKANTNFGGGSMTQELRTTAQALLDAEGVHPKYVADIAFRKEAHPAAILALLDRLEKAEKDAARCKRFIDAMCEETFDTWTNGYRMQQVAMNIQHAMSITAEMETSND